MTNLYRGVPTWDSLFLSLIILKFKGEKIYEKEVLSRVQHKAVQCPVA